jgi:late competence protein required for DNA uptake (superfamily II DNA/RNA helicase)
MMNCPRCQKAEMQDKSRNGQGFLVCPSCNLLKVGLRSSLKTPQIALDQQPRLSLNKLVYGNKLYQKSLQEAQIQQSHEQDLAHQDFQRQAQSLLTPPAEDVLFSQNFWS